MSFHEKKSNQVFTGCSCNSRNCRRDGSSYAVDTASQDSVAHMQKSAVEVSKLHAEIAKQASAGDATAVADLENLKRYHQNRSMS